MATDPAGLVSAPATVTIAVGTGGGSGGSGGGGAAGGGGGGPAGGGPGSASGTSSTPTNTSQAAQAAGPHLTLLVSSKKAGAKRVKLIVKVTNATVFSGAVTLKHVAPKGAKVIAVAKPRGWTCTTVKQITTCKRPVMKGGTIAKFTFTLAVAKQSARKSALSASIAAKGRPVATTTAKVDWYRALSHPLAG
jgi:hypothetical protein